MHTFYIDIPHGFKYDHSNGDGDVTVARQLGVPIVEFICNSVAKISDGDVYEVTVKDEQDETFLILKYGFRTIDRSVVEEYRARKRREYERYSWHESPRA